MLNCRTSQIASPARDPLWSQGVREDLEEDLKLPAAGLGLRRPPQTVARRRSEIPEKFEGWPGCAC